jgi:hypothetical protein
LECTSSENLRRSPAEHTRNCTGFIAGHVGFIGRAELATNLQPRGFYERIDAGAVAVRDAGAVPVRDAHWGGGGGGQGRALGRRLWRRSGTHTGAVAAEVRDAYWGGGGGGQGRAMGRRRRWSGTRTGAAAEARDAYWGGGGGGQALARPRRRTRLVVGWLASCGNPGSHARKKRRPRTRAGERHNHCGNLVRVAVRASGGALDARFRSASSRRARLPDAVGGSGEGPARHPR